MSKINLKLPTQVRVIGDLYDRSNPHNLDQDMLEVILPDGIVIDVGWYPDWNPNGEYRLIVFRSDAVDYLLEPEVKTRSVKKICSEVYRHVSKYLSKISPLGAGGTSLFLSVNGAITSAQSPQINTVSRAAQSLVVKRF